MSIVGTRPPLISETNLYEPRHKVRKLNWRRIDESSDNGRRKRHTDIFCGV